MDDNVTLVVFEIDGQRYALPLRAVVRVVRAVEVTALPHAPPTIYGAINVQGRVIPVLNMRQRLGYPERALDLSDEFLIVQVSHRWLALWVDAVSDVIDIGPQAMIAAEQIAPGLEGLASVVKLANGLLLVQDPERLFATCEPGTWDQTAVSGEARA
jgi:purine-binding chemotaxis protein CheW